MLARPAVTLALGSLLILCLFAYSNVNKTDNTLVSLQQSLTHTDKVALIHALANHRKLKLQASLTDRSRKEKEEAREEELQDCAPFCDIGEKKRRNVKDARREVLREAEKHQPVSFKHLSVAHPASHKKLTKQDKRKIAEAAQEIESSLEVSSMSVPKDVKDEMAKIRSSGTGWKALWGMGKRKGMTLNDARFEYLAGKSVRSSTVKDPLAAKDPFTEDFHY
uniref:Uncharacterized protein n=1 Tax=Hanusia phi TaxID=3032 RepID=A0A7S0F0V1_9CRYP